MKYINITYEIDFNSKRKSINTFDHIYIYIII